VTAVERAVLLAAGRGTRLGEIARQTPKPLLSVGGQPMLHRIIGGLAAAGIRDFSIVTGHMAAAVGASTGDGAKWGVAIRYHRQPAIDGTARALALARDDLGEGPFFVGWGDIVVALENYANVLAASAAAIGVNRVEDPSAGAAVYIDDAGFATRLVEKPPRGSSTTNWNNAGLMVLPPEIWRFVDALTPSARGEYELPAAVAAYLEAGGRVRAVPIDGPWFDAGTPESLAAARAYFGP
jgi:dTDP-glucose pyrophosphorylase